MTHGTIAELEPQSVAPESGAQQSHLASLFQAAARRGPERIALSFASHTVTYAALAAQANAIAAGLQQRGIGPESIVAILLERGPEMIAAMLGIVQAGAAYLPLDPRYPAARIAETLADAGAQAVIAQDLIDASIDAQIDVLDVATLLQTAGEARPIRLDAAAPAYIIYTSGSTGKPKGVVVSHRNVARLFSATVPWFHFGPADVWTMFHSFAFDFSVWEIWGALLHGGRLVLVPYETSRSPEDFRALLVREQVTILNQTPSAFALLDAADARAQAGDLALRAIIFGGEALCGRQLAAWIARHGETAPALLNMYGITETTVHVTFRRMLRADAVERDNLIGEPIPDLQLHLLDEQLQPVARGCEGELCIAGAGVADGYLHRAELTAERFVPDPFGPGKLYRSGDVARRREDGELVYLGRRDGQVKLNGFRIETGEIEAALLAHPDVCQACVITRPGPGGAGRLLAFYQAERDLQPGSFLAARLPAHMLPSLYRRVPAMPLNLNGKIDRSALPEVTFEASSTTLKTSLAPTFNTTCEQRIAAVWQRVLGVQAIGLDDNFFDAGGTSLLLIAARAGLEQEFARTLPITWMFECTTVRTMAARLQQDAKPAASSGMQPSALQANAIQANAGKQRQAFARAKAWHRADSGAAR